MGFFDLISLVLKLVGLWEGFLDFLDKKHSAELELRRQRREAALDQAEKAETPEDAFAAQDKILDNSN